VKDLRKLDLDPNTIYNVSVSVTQGQRKFDNLRFFQTEVPKLFNIIPGQYSTFSRLTTGLKPVLPVFGGGTLNPATLQTIQVKTVEWEADFVTDTSEGETTYNIEKSTVTFKITLESEPPTFVFKIDNFGSKFACLNGRSDWVKPKNTNAVREVTIPLREFDPDITAFGAWKNKDTSTLVSKFPTPVGAGLIYVKTKPKSIVKNVSTVKASIRAGTKYINPFAEKTKVTLVQKTAEPYYITVNPPALIAFANDTALTFQQYVWDFGLNWSMNRSKKGSEDSPARLQYYSAPSFSPITRTYSFSGNSSVSSEVLNSTVLDALIWEDDVRDFIYFFISDTSPNGNWYYFDNSSSNGGIVAAKYGGAKISGTALSVGSGTGEERLLNAPPNAPVYVTNTSGYPSYPSATLRAKAEFYNLSKKNAVDDATVPSLTYPISIRFAIARYTKNTDGTWSKVWQGGPQDKKKIKDVLSLEEQLS